METLKHSVYNHTCRCNTESLYSTQTSETDLSVVVSVHIAYVAWRFKQSEESGKAAKTRSLGERQRTARILSCLSSLLDFAAFLLSSDCLNRQATRATVHIKNTKKLSKGNQRE